MTILTNTNTLNIGCSVNCSLLFFITFLRSDKISYGYSLKENVFDSSRSSLHCRIVYYI